MHEAIGLGFQSRRTQIFFSARDILSRFYHPGQKPPALLSRWPCPGSKTGTNSPLEPGQMARSVVVREGKCACAVMSIRVYILRPRVQLHHHPIYASHVTG